MYDDDFFKANDDDILKGNQSSQAHHEYHQGNGADRGMYEVLRKLFGNNADLMRAFNATAANTFLISKSVQVFSEVSEILKESNEVSMRNAALRALIVTVDEITNGAVSLKTQAYALERQLLGHHLNLDMTSKCYYAIINSEASPTELSVDVVDYLSTYINILQHCLLQLKDDYMVACGVANIEVKEQLLDYGTFESADLAFYLTSNLPIYNQHYEMGDVSNIHGLRTELVQNMADALARFVLDPVD